MNRDASAAAGTTGTRCTCTACPLLCDDISLTPAGADRACDLGRAAFAAALPSLAADDASPDNIRATSSISTFPAAKIRLECGGSDWVTLRFVTVDVA